MDPGQHARGPLGRPLGLHPVPVAQPGQGGIAAPAIGDDRGPGATTARTTTSRSGMGFGIRSMAPSRSASRASSSVAKALRNLLLVLKNGRFVVFLLIFSGFWVVFWQQYISLPIYVRTYVDPNANIDRLLAVEAGTVIACTFLVNYLTRRLPAFPLIIAGVLISSLSWLVLTLGASTPYVVAALIVLALGEVTQAPRYYEYISRLAPPGQQGLFMGYAFLPIGIGYLISGPTAGALLHHFGEVVKQPQQMWYVVAGAGLLTTVLMIAYNRVVRPTMGVAAGQA